MHQGDPRVFAEELFFVYTHRCLPSLLTATASTTLKGDRSPFSAGLLIKLFCDLTVDSGGTPGLHHLHGHASPRRSASAGIGPRRCIEAHRGLFFRET